MAAINSVNPKGDLSLGILHNKLLHVDYTILDSGIPYIFNCFSDLCEVVFAIKDYHGTVGDEADVSAGDPVVLLQRRRDVSNPRAAGHPTDCVSRLPGVAKLWRIALSSRGGFLYLFHCRRIPSQHPRDDIVQMLFPLKSECHNHK